MLAPEQGPRVRVWGQGVAAVICQSTEDATKWNECLGPAQFALMHHYLFDGMHRLTLNGMKNPPINKVFLSIAWKCHLFQAWKQVQLGPGVLIVNEKFFARLNWIEGNVEQMNEFTREWYKKIEKNLSGDGEFLHSSGGMLMGMLNAASTTFGLLAANYNMSKMEMRVLTLRSSDDSTTKYISSSNESNAICVDKNERNLSLIGINLSPDKTFFFQENYAEFTSWYIHGRFVSQFGTEVPSLRPQGKNPADDLYAIAKNTTTLVQTLGINHLGAAARLRIGINVVKMLWKLPPMYSNIREGISPRVQLIEDGGEILWNVACCHLNQHALKEHFASTDAERNYLKRTLNPENPFSEKVEEDITYSREYGCFVWVNEIFFK